METIKVYVGLDVHKKTIEVGIADTECYEARHYGRISNDPEQIAAMARKLDDEGRELHFCYEAGPCGYVVYRQLTKLGYRCDVIAPSTIPRRAGDRVKTDRRDCLNLARLYRAGELQTVWVPDQPHEAIRELVRAVIAARRDLAKRRVRCTHFLLRHGHVYPKAGAHWSLTRKKWIRTRRLDEPALQIVLEDHLQDIERLETRCGFLEKQLREMIPRWSLYPQVQALQALRGVGLFGAMVLSAEIGSIARFEHPKKLTGFVGLGMSEYSSGESVRRGRITKTGNGDLRWLLVEAAWRYRAKPAGKWRSADTEMPPAVREIAWRAQQRLYKRYWHLTGKGKSPQASIVAIARELLGFIWEIAGEVERQENCTWREAA